MTSRLLLRSMVPVLVVGFVALSFNDAAARAGRGRSFGSRGSSSYSGSSRSAPSYGSRGPQQSPWGTGTGGAFGLGQQGGFLRGLAGGVVGGLVGGMLFRSLGFAGPGAGMGGGGIGLFDLVLLGGGAYLLYRFVAARRRNGPARAGAGFFGTGAADREPVPPRQGFPAFDGWSAGAGPGGGELADALSRIRQSDPSFDQARFRDTAQDIFFRVQGAWTRRDLASVEALLDDEVRGTLQADVEELRRRGEVNRLENIAVREADIVEAWQAAGRDFLTLRLLASLLDYTTDETGRVVSGSNSDPVKFEEYWTFARPTGLGTWKLSAIQQA
ncbi:MAG: Tim44 domain-containing protein [Deltaproteobacteria bacterium]|nr:Tim44 domain-containing protein [Deltaproteobacteria bacterium]